MILFTTVIFNTNMKISKQYLAIQPPGHYTKFSYLLTYTEMSTCFSNRCTTAFVPDHRDTFHVSSLLHKHKTVDIQGQEFHQIQV